MDFGLRLGFLGHILGFVKPLGSTHGTEHFGSNLISRHWDRRAQIQVGTKQGVYYISKGMGATTPSKIEVLGPKTEVLKF